MKENTKSLQTTITSDYSKTYMFFEEFCKYTSEKIDVLKEITKILSRNFTVLDIGCGTGALTIPIAKQVKRVTALDPSFEVLKFLKFKAIKENLNNIEFVNKRWEEAKLSEIGVHDLVLCSHTLYFINDWYNAIEKMLNVTKKYLIIILHSHKGEFYNFLKTYWQIVKNTSYPEAHDYCYVCKMLRERDIKFKVKLINSKISLPGISKALELCKFFFETPEISAKAEEKLLEFFSKKLEEKEKIIIEDQNAMIIIRK